MLVYFLSGLLDALERDLRGVREGKFSSQWLIFKKELLTI